MMWLPLVSELKPQMSLAAVVSFQLSKTGRTLFARLLFFYQFHPADSLAQHVGQWQVADRYHHLYRCAFGSLGRYMPALSD